MREAKALAHSTQCDACTVHGARCLRPVRYWAFDDDSNQPRQVCAFHGKDDITLATTVAHSSAPDRREQANNSTGFQMLYGIKYDLG